MLGMAAESSPTRLVQLLSCSAAQEEALTPSQPPLPRSLQRGRDGSPPPTPVCHTLIRLSPPTVCAVHNQHQLSYPPWTLTCHTCYLCYTHTLTQSGMSCHSHTQSVSHTCSRPGLFSPSNTGSAIQFQKSLDSSLCQGLRAPPNLCHIETVVLGCHLYPHTYGQPITPSLFIPSTHQVTLLSTYTLSHCPSSVSYTDCGHHPLTYFFLCSGGSNRAASPKSPTFSSMLSVMKKFPR